MIHLRRDRELLVKLFPRGHVKALTDLHYSPLTRMEVIKIICKHRKPRSRELTMEEKNYNRRHSDVRNKIEGAIGDIKNRFGSRTM